MGNGLFHTYYHIPTSMGFVQSVTNISASDSYSSINFAVIQSSGSYYYLEDTRKTGVNFTNYTNNKPSAGAIIRMRYQ